MLKRELVAPRRVLLRDRVVALSGNASSREGAPEREGEKERERER